MGRILQLDKVNYDLWLSYSWSNNNHGICGHTFEVIDYYLLLKNFFRVGIFLAEDINWETFQASILSKYDLTQDELYEIKRHTVFSNRPSLVSGNNILFTDGGVRSLRDKTLFFDKIFHFACGDFEIKDNKNPKVFILQDERIYPACFNGINYKKKINFSRYKKVGPGNDDFLLYGTKNCRAIPDSLYNELLELYPDKQFLCLTNKENRPVGLPDRMKVVDMPVEDLFEKFGTYIYTPVPRKFDCSPRFIAECKFYGKEVIYHNIDYWDEDKGLYWRKWDLDHDFQSIFLTENDDIINILKERI